MNNKTLFLDWHETLSSDRFFDTLRHSNDSRQKNIAARLEQFLFIENNDLVQQWMIGKTSSEDVIQLTAKSCDLDYKWLWPLFVADCKNMNLASGLREKILLLKEHYNVVLITGNMDCFNRFTRPQHNLDECFDLIINSCDQGYLKTDHNGRAFADALKTYKMAAINSVLVDDSQTAGDIFTALGGYHHAVKSPIETSTYLGNLLQSHFRP